MMRLCHSHKSCKNMLLPESCVGCLKSYYVSKCCPWGQNEAVRHMKKFESCLEKKNVKIDLTKLLRPGKSCFQRQDWIMYLVGQLICFGSSDNIDRGAVKNIAQVLETHTKYSTFNALVPQMMINWKSTDHISFHCHLQLVFIFPQCMDWLLPQWIII